MQTSGSGPREYPIDASAKADVPVDTAVRLCRQERKVLALLLACDEVSNVRLAQISLKYFSKISALRAAGYDVQLRRENGETGVAWYHLTSPVPRLRTYRVPVEVRVPGFQAKLLTFTVQAVSPRSARYRAWRAVKVIALSPPTEIFPASQGELFYRSPSSSRSTAE
jgi:hypothetical protein